jgi:hypothetical protein
MLEVLVRLLQAGCEMEDEAGVESQLLDEGLREGLAMDLCQGTPAAYLPVTGQGCLNRCGSAQAG